MRASVAIRFMVHLHGVRVATAPHDFYASPRPANRTSPMAFLHAEHFADADGNSFVRRWRRTALAKHSVHSCSLSAWSNPERATSPIGRTRSAGVRFRS